MYNKKHIVITAVVTFFATALLFFASNMLPYNFLQDRSSFTNKAARVASLLDKYYIDADKLDTSKMEDSALAAYVYTGTDDYTMYMSGETYNEIKSTFEGDYLGVGVEVFVDPDDSLITVLSPLEGSPAQKAGILRGDKIIAVDSNPVNLENYDYAIEMMKGSHKTADPKTVDITVKRGDKTLDFTVKRAKIKTKSVSYEILDDIGYIRISTFDINTYADFKNALNFITKSGANGLVIDLRNNPGGILEIVCDITDLIIGEGTIVSVEGTVKMANKTYKSDKNELGIPLAVIVNDQSASGSEVLVGAVRDHKKGTVIGTKTFGKGLVQTVFNLDDDSAVKITTAKYYTPNGECINEKGIEPDINIEMDILNSYPYTNSVKDDAHLSTAIEILRN